MTVPGGLDIAHWRMRNLRLNGPALSTAAEVVSWLGAVQSQDHGPAGWAVAQRATGLTAADLEMAFAAGEILRTHALRPTWHYLAPADIRWILGVTSPRVHAMNAYYVRQLELDDRLLADTQRWITDALHGGRYLTRAEIGAVLDRAGVTAQGQRLAYLLMHAELEGAICSGPMNGRQHTYALLAERAPLANAEHPADPRAELAVRYFTSHGPATVKDFRWWCSLTIAEIRQALTDAGPRLSSETIDGTTYWYAGAPPRHRPPAPTIHLLQGYDEYIVGYSESKWLLDASGTVRQAIADRTVPIGVVILDSQVVGHWKRTIQRDAVHIDVVLHRPLDEAQTRALAEAGERHGRFLGRAASVRTAPL